MVRDDSCGVEKSGPRRVVSDGGPRFADVFEALSRVRRRRVLYYLQDVERASISEIARKVSAWEHECPVDDVPDEETIALETMLYHTHLPKLRAARIIEYDERSGVAVLCDPPDLVEMCLDYCAERDLPD